MFVAYRREVRCKDRNLLAVELAVAPTVEAEEEVAAARRLEQLVGVSCLRAIVATLRFNPVPDEDMLPEARKEIADAMWETIVQIGVDCIFDDRLPAAEEYSYMEVPLSTVPVLMQQTNAAGWLHF